MGPVGADGTLPAATAADASEAEADGVQRVRVLDLGCGQGTQALRLARAGYAVTGLDGSEPMLADFARALDAEDEAVRTRVALVRGEVTEAADRFGPGAFDVVLCHGVLMYLADPGPLLDSVARVLVPGGLLSLLVRNGDATALRPGFAGDWTVAAAAFDGSGYRNRLGVDARADRREELTAQLAERGLDVEAWYGVRVLTDYAADDAPVPADPDELALLLECEERAGRTDPYRAIAALTHLMARRRSSGDSAEGG
ncbi:class I SAM-dependent methyltransferase [Actinospica durhamensis]|uniref:class I SAM-dependent methyltransferase n=1 Tax=Actinospica durhamensis TaxID=1508375 RepID=UPI003F68634A